MIVSGSEILFGMCLCKRFIAFCLLSVAVLAVMAVSRADETEKKREEKSPAEIAAATQKRMESMALYFKGQRIFENQCAPCHGATGKGNGPWSTTLENKPRNFRSGIFKFRTTPYGKLPSDDDLRRTIRSGISGTAMPTFQKLPDSDLDAIVVYVQTFSRRWRDASLYAAPMEIPKVPDWFRETEKSAVEIEEGAVLFAQMCASCHGPKGKGDGLAAKSLKDVWEQPIVPADLSQPHHKSGDAPTDLFRTIATGLDGTPMIGFHGTLKPEQIWGLVAYIQSLEVESAAENP